MATPLSFSFDRLRQIFNPNIPPPMPSHPRPTSGVTTGWDEPNSNPLGAGMQGPPVNIPPPEPIPGPPQRTPQTPLNPPRQTMPFGMQQGGLNTNQPYPQMMPPGGLPNIPSPTQSAPTMGNYGPSPVPVDPTANMRGSMPAPSAPKPGVQPTTPPFGMPQNPQLNTRQAYPAVNQPEVDLATNINQTLPKRPSFAFDEWPASVQQPIIRRPTMGFQTEEEISDAPLAYPPAEDPMEAQMEEEYPDQPDWTPDQPTTGIPATPRSTAPSFQTEYPKIFGEEGVTRGPKSIGPPMPPPDTAPDTSGFTPGTVYTPTNIIQKHWPTAPPELTEEDEINQLLGKWKPETSMQERLTGLLNTMPQRPQDISNWRKLGSFMVGLGQGPEAQERATYAPFYRSMADWQAQFEPTSKAAQLENTGNINLRQLLHNEAMEKAANRRIANQEQAERRRQYTAEQKASIDRAKLEAANLKAQDANWEYVDNQQTGTVWMVHPRLGAKDTKIPHGEFSDLERAQWRRGDIETRARETAANKPRKWQYFYDYSEDPERPVYKRQDEETGEIEVVGMPRPPARNGSPQGTTQIPPNTGSPVIGKPPSATQRQAGLETKVAEARGKWPEYSEHINWNDQTGLPEITPPSDPWFGDKKVPYDDATYQMIYNYIFGTGKSTPVQGQNQQGNTRTTSKGTVVTRID